MKCFEILKEIIERYDIKINRKHEMFWNLVKGIERNISNPLTVNMKCFEMQID